MNQFIGRLNYSLLSFLKHRINGGVLLMVVAVIAMIMANSPWSHHYLSLWEYPIILQIGDFNVFSVHGEPLTLMEFINNALMVLFFFSVGLEIKRELLVGELSSFRKALLPIIAALGGMIVPVLIYFTLTKGTPGQAGLAIPMATDIAFSLGVLSLFGKRVPISLKIFLTAFAIVDDIGGILVIALFYSSDLAPEYLGLALALLFILFLGNKRGIKNKNFYCLIGLVVWYFFLQSGVNATFAGVLVAFLIPATPSLRVGRYVNRIKNNVTKIPIGDSNIRIFSPREISLLKSIESASDKVISPLQALEDKMNGLVNYFIVPLFAFANAGIVLSGGGESLIGNITYGVSIALVLGKFVGIFSFTYLAIKMKLVSMPAGMNWSSLAGTALLGGIGFTVSLFIAQLSFVDSPELLNQAKLGVLLGTIISGVIGYLVLHFVLPKKSYIDRLQMR
ncbi:MAG: Na+/H+ antiporter NhaA [Bacteroides sp.]|nr:Na+/H+ antiporter NhaA [Bacteroides sp.]MDD4055318.1 Na+/H+ antiporter NhaA [Bacteroides sp.]MDD4719648.1 Na+/H+ antiporter NhaA [Bacteroides sp.]